MSRFRLLAALPPVLVALLLQAAPASAQCPDGTPPPCGTRTARAPARASAPPAEERGRSFLVLPFRNVTRAEEHAWLVEGSPMLLADALNQWDEVSVVPPERLYPALRRHGLEPGEVMPEDEVRRVAEETRGWTAVTGDVLAMGQAIRVSARAYDVVNEDVVVEATAEVAAEADIRTAYEELAGRLLETAGLEGGAPNLAEATTGSLDAYRAYLRGVAHYNRGEVRQAREELLEAVRIDTTFAQAYAKLAAASMTSVQAYLDPSSDGYRYAEKASALSHRLPERERTLIQAFTAIFRGEFSEARDRYEQLVAADPNDVEALEDLADLEMFDGVLVETPDGLRRRGSMNRSVVLAKRALELDPTRHTNFNTLTAVYALVGGNIGGRVPAVRSEASSLPAYLMSLAQPAVIFVPIIQGDTIGLLTADSVTALDPEVLDASRRTALQAAAAWVERWLAVAPDEAAAHAAAGTVYELLGEYDRALDHVRVADSLGVETEMEDPVGRRLVILAKRDLGGEALVLADSLMEAGYFDTPALGMNRFMAEHAAWAMHVYLLNGRMERAEELVRTAEDALSSAVPDTTVRQALAVCTLLCRGAIRTFTGLIQIPDSVRLRTWQGALSSLEALPEDALLARRIFSALDWSLEPGHFIPAFGGGDRAPWEVRQELAGMARDAAAAETGAGRHDRAAQLLAFTIHADTTEAGLEASYRGLRDLLAVAPEHPQALYQLGKVGAVGGIHLGEAEEALRTFLALDDEESRGRADGAHWRLGQIAEHRGEMDEARRQYEAALEINPEYQNARAALEALEGGG